MSHPGVLMRSVYRTTLLMAAQCAATFLLTAQTPPKLIIHGADPDRARALGEAYRDAEARGDVSVREFIRSWYRGRGYYRADAESVATDGARSMAWVREGKPTYVGEITITGFDGDLSVPGAASMVLRPGDVFLERVLEDDLKRMLTELADAGYLEARIDRDAVTEEEDDEGYRLFLTMNVVKGSLATIDSVRFEGLTLTDPGTAAKLTRLDHGDAWSKRAGKAARRRLSRLQIFSDVSEPQLFLSGPGRVTVGFDVAEGRPNAIDGVLGYLPPAVPGGAGTVTGLVDLQFRNLFGSARRLHARWYQERQGRHEIEVSYREPSIAGFPVAGEVGVFQRRQDSTYVRLDGSLSLDAEVGLDMTAGLTLTVSSTTPIEGYGKLVLPQSSSTYAGVRFAYDTRDRTVAAREGMLYATSLEAGRKSSDFGGTASASGTQRISFDAEYYSPTFLHQVLVLTARWREIAGNDIDASDLYRLGGSTDLRGYRENEFAGTRVLMQTTEYRFFLSASSYLGGFIDLASIHTGTVTGPVATQDLFRAGYGVTSLLQTAIGSVGVSIAMGKGDGIGDAKLHVRLRTEF